MKIFISYSAHDKKIVEQIVARLQQEGHDVWVDSLNIRPGDNIQKAIDTGLKEADALIVVVSKNSQNSMWVQYEFSTMALSDISKRERRTIPVKIDNSEVPGYLGSVLYIDFSENFASGLDRLVDALRIETPQSLRTPVQQPQGQENAREGQVTKLSEVLRKGRLTLVCGAGVSIDAGVPAWSSLLLRLLEIMMKRISQGRSSDLNGELTGKFHSQNGASSLVLGKYLKNNLGNDFQSEVRSALYASNPTTSPLISSIVRLSRPQRDGRPLDSIVTFNFDSLMEECLTKDNVINKSIFSEAVHHESNEIPVYHVHGYLPRMGSIPEDMDLVFSEDAYHSQFIDPFSWSNLIQLTKLTHSTCLFVGVSLTDPNMRRLLDVAWRKNPNKKMAHFIVRRLPCTGDPVLDEVTKLLEEQDANGLGLNVVWFEDYKDVPQFLCDVADRNGA